MSRSPVRSEARLADELHRCVSRVRTVGGSLTMMARIQATFGREDGVWWFTELYRLVTEAVRDRCADAYFEDPAWMEILVVEFSKRYFEALWLWLTGHRAACPAPWRAFFANRFAITRPYYSPLQGALAGVNAHIQRDLGFAAWRACRRRRLAFTTSGAAYRDFVRVNEILAEVEVRAMRQMATGWIRKAGDLIQPWDHRAAMLVIRAARWVSWRTTAAYLWLLRRHPRLASLWLASLDGYGWLCGQALMLPSFSQGEPWAERPGRD